MPYWMRFDASAVLAAMHAARAQSSTNPVHLIEESNSCTIGSPRAAVGGRVAVRISPRKVVGSPCQVVAPPYRRGSSHKQGGELTSKRLGVALAAALVLVATATVTALSAASDNPASAARSAAKSDKFVFFASDGMRQDLIDKYLDKDSTLREFLKKGTHASGNGLLTEAPPNTGAGWYSLATGAWPGVHGSTNNTFHINGTNFANSTSFSTPGVMKAETIAQAAERAGKKVAQMEWVGGANGKIQGPTIDFQSFSSGRGVATNFTGGAPYLDIAANIASFGLQFDHPA